MSTVKSSSADLTLNAEGAGNDVIIQGNGTNTATVTAEGLMQFNSGYGSVATAYGCRAWVNFNGTGTVVIDGSGNVSSITDNGTGDYTVNFTTAMPDDDYAEAFGNLWTGVSPYIAVPRTTTKLTTSLTYGMIKANGAFVDENNQSVTIFR
jgi:hypothetical protein